MTRRGSARADAIRRAHEAKAARDAARQHREALIESALTDYYQAAALGERIRDSARRKADEVLAEAERTALPQDTAAAGAVRCLRELLGGITETAELCGLTTAAVRDLLTGRDPARTTDHDNSQNVGRPATTGTQPAADAQPVAGGDRDDQ